MALSVQNIFVFSLTDQNLHPILLHDDSRLVISSSLHKLSDILLHNKFLCLGVLYPLLGVGSDILVNQVEPKSGSTPSLHLGQEVTDRLHVHDLSSEEVLLDKCEQVEVFLGGGQGLQVCQCIGNFLLHVEDSHHCLHGSVPLHHCRLGNIL